MRAKFYTLNITCSRFGNTILKMTEVLDWSRFTEPIVSLAEPRLINRNLPEGKTDVMDRFAENVLLKASEGVASMCLTLLKTTCNVKSKN